MINSTWRWVLSTNFQFFSLLVLSLFLPTTSWGRVFLTQEEALKLAFPMSTQVDRKSLFFSPDEMEQIQKTAKSKFDDAYWAYYVGKSSSGLDGYALFDSHLVRTMPETLMTVLNPDGTIRYVEILEFNEPEDYKPSKKWLNLFKQKTLRDQLWIRRGLRNMTGSTLTTHAIADSIRKILAVYNLFIKESRE